MNSYTHIYEHPGMYDVIDHYDRCFPELASPTDTLTGASRVPDG